MACVFCKDPSKQVGPLIHEKSFQDLINLTKGEEYSKACNIRDDIASHKAQHAILNAYWKTRCFATTCMECFDNYRSESLKCPVCTESIDCTKSHSLNFVYVNTKCVFCNKPQERYNIPTHLRKLNCDCIDDKTFVCYSCIKLNTTATCPKCNSTANFSKEIDTHKHYY